MSFFLIFSRSADLRAGPLLVDQSGARAERPLGSSKAGSRQPAEPAPREVEGMQALRLCSRGMDVPDGAAVIMKRFNHLGDVIECRWN